MKIIAYYIVFQLLILIILLLISKAKDKRLNKRHGQKVPPGFQKTEEVMFDPTTGKRLEVYYHPNSGERFYKEEMER